MQPFVHSHFMFIDIQREALSIPFMKDKDEPGLAPVLGEMRASSEVEEFWCTNATGPWTTLVEWVDGSSPTTRTLRLNI